MQAICATQGWFVLHVFYRIDRQRWGDLDLDRRLLSRHRLCQLMERFRAAENCQGNAYAVVGHKADFGLMLIDPELNHLSQTENDLLKVFPEGIIEPVYSFISMTETSEYMSQDADYDRVLREKEGLDPSSAEYQEKMGAFSKRMGFYINERLHPVLIQHKVMCFYPMNKARRDKDNWYALDFDTRKCLMGGHLITGRKFAGKVKQLVTGSVGLDQWEWGVTLFADDPYYLKKIVYEMRFDQVSAYYGEFGDFLLGIHLEGEELFDRLRL